MPLHRGVVDRHGLEKSVERHVANVFVVIQQEPTQDIDSQNPEKNCNDDAVARKEKERIFNSK